MSKKRNSMDIVATILKIAQGGSKKTHVVYKANLNFKILREYIILLKKAGLITTNDRGLISTTEKGSDYLKHYDGFVKYAETTFV